MLLCKYWARDPMSSCPGPLTHLYEALNLAEWMRRRKVADLPGFGWHMAQALEERSQPCPLLERPAYKWVGNALTFLQATGQIPADNSELWAVSEADGLFRKGTRRVLLQATLLADDATIDAVAAAVGMPPLVVEAFAALFFNVLGHRNHPGLLFEAAHMALMPRGTGLYMPQMVYPLEKALLHAGLHGTIDDVMRLDACIGRDLLITRFSELVKSDSTV